MEFFRFEEFACRCCGRIPPGVRGNIEALVDNVLDPVQISEHYHPRFQ